MGVKFFGQHLVDKGVITTEQLLDAMEEHDEMSVVRLAVAKNMLEVGEAKDLVTQAKAKQVSVLAYATSRGFFSPEQAEYLQFLRRSDARRLCEVLLAKGYVAHDELEFAVDAFNREQEMYALRAQSLPAEHAGRAEMVALLSMLQNLLHRYGIAPVHLSAPAIATGRMNVRELTVEMGLTGDHPATFVLSLDRHLGVVLAGQLFGHDDLHEEAVLRDALGEFCNLVTGATASAMAPLGHEMSFAPPRVFDQGVPFKLITKAAYWEIQTPWGSATLFVE